MYGSFHFTVICTMPAYRMQTYVVICCLLWAQLSLCQQYTSRLSTNFDSPNTTQLIGEDHWHRLIFTSPNGIKAFDGEASYTIDTDNIDSLVDIYALDDITYFINGSRLLATAPTWRSKNTIIQTDQLAGPVAVCAWHQDQLIYQTSSKQVILRDIKTGQEIELPYIGPRLRTIGAVGDMVYLFGDVLFTYNISSEKYTEEDVVLPRATAAIVQAEEEFFVLSESGQLWRIQADNFNSEYTSRLPINSPIIASGWFDKKLIIVTSREGIVLFDTKSKQINRLSPSDDLCFDQISGAYISDSHTIWTTNGKQLCLTKNQYPVLANKALGLRNENIRIVAPTGNQLLFTTTENGFYQYANNQFQRFNRSNGFINKQVSVIKEGAENNVLVGVPGAGIISFNADKTFSFPQYPHAIDGKINHIFTFDDKSIYLTEAHGIWASPTIGTAPIRATRLFPSRLSTIIDAQRIGQHGLVLASSKKLFSFNSVNSELRLLADLSAHGTIKDIALWNGQVHVLFGNEIISVPLAGSGKRQTNQTRERLQLPPPYVSIHAARDNIYLSNDRQTFVLSSATFDAKKSPKVKQQLPFRINRNTLCEHQGKLAAGTNKGLQYIIPTENKNSKARLVFKQISVNDKAAQPKKNKYIHDENNWQFNVGIIDPQLIHSGTISWQLEHRTNHLHGETENGNIQFSLLPPGRYKFTASSTIASNQLEYAFTIAPKWTASIYYRMLIGAFIVLLVGLLSFLLSRYRTRAIRKKNAQLEARNELLELRQKSLQLQMNPHFMFNAMNSIQGLVGKDDKKARYYIAKLGKLMRSTLEHARKKWISIADEISLLEAYLDLEKLHHRFEYTIEKNNIDSNWRIPPMMIQPLVENAVKHGVQKLPHGEGKITIQFHVVGRKVRCTISDNGPGFISADKSHTSLSTKVIDERMALYSASGTFVDPIVYVEKEIGVEVYIGLPYQDN